MTVMVFESEKYVTDLKKIICVRIFFQNFNKTKLKIFFKKNQKISKIIFL